MKPHRQRRFYDVARQYIVFFDTEVNLSWDIGDVDRFILYWEDGKSLVEMAKKFDRPALEVALLVLDLAEQGRIENRPMGIF